MIQSTSFYSEFELIHLGFKSIGHNVHISKNASFYGIEKMIIGDNVRIDDFCILSGDIILGSHIHISAYCGLYGSKGIELENYTGISPRSTVFSAMDDFSGNYLIGPIHPDQYTHVTGGKVLFKKYSQIGAGCIVFPDVTLEEGAVVGAMSLVNKSLPAWTISAGIPVQIIKNRNKKILSFNNL